MSISDEEKMYTINSIIPAINIPDIMVKGLQRKENVDTINIFIDLKNISTGLYVEDICNTIINNNKNSTDLSIFQSVLNFIIKWKYVASKLNKKCNIYIHTDYGQSMYHKELLESYKENRQLRKTNLNYDYEKINEIFSENCKIMQDFLNNIHNVYFINLNFLESDFISYYVIKEMGYGENKYFNIVCSSDKDNYQVLNFNNSVIYSKVRNNYKIISIKNVLEEFLELDRTTKNYTKYKQMLDKVRITNITLMMSIIGDSSDDIKGIDGIGKKKTLELFSKYNIWDIINTGNVLVNNDKFLNKILENRELILNNYKLIDYECLINWLKENNTFPKQEKLEYLNGVLNKNNGCILKENTKDINDLFKYFKNNTDFYIGENEFNMLFE